MATQHNRYLTAEQIHDGNGWLPAGTIIEISNDGTVIALHEKTNEIVETFEGILAPGFINVHCHLELSHMQGVVPEKTGLIPFLQAIPAQRNNFTEEQKKAARHAAYQELVVNGVVAVGDIANSNETLDIRLLDALHMHTFVECIGFTIPFARARLDYSLGIRNEFGAQPAGDKRLSQSVIPHAPYSVSRPLFELINGVDPESIISVHNQESRAEDEYYLQKTGSVRDLLGGLGIDDTFFQHSGKSSLQTYLPYFSPGHAMVMVHNTFTAKADVVFAEQRFPFISWCLCPNANLYIEGALPDVPMLQAETHNICIGTDSLASNHGLSVLAELKTLKDHFPDLEWELLLQWGTRNGAKALKMDNRLGCITTGRQPGILNIINLTDDPTVQRVI